MTFGQNPSSHDDRPSGADPTDAFGRLSSALWAQRSLIEVLQYRLEVQLLIGNTANERHLQFAVKEVETAIADIRKAEGFRDDAARSCAHDLRLAQNSTLTQIRDASPEPWKSALADHQKALLNLVNETERLSKMNREAAIRGAKETKSMFAAITGSIGNETYERDGTSRGLTAPPALLNRDA